MENIKEYIGAILGVIVGIVFVAFGLWYPVLVIGIIIGFAYMGNYAQKNKTELKEKLKNFIDKI